MGNIVRARVSIKGTRTLLQHQFGPDAIPLEKAERSGVAGNDPTEWKRSCMITDDNVLYLPGPYFFSCLKNGAIHTKKGRGSLQAPLVSTLQIEEDMVLLSNRVMPEKVTEERVLTPVDKGVLVFVYVASVRNPATKGRNVRYRLAARAGWRAVFTMLWDKTIVSREQMRAILKDSGTLGGLGDGIKIGCGRFEVLKYEELEDKIGGDEEEELEEEEEEIPVHRNNGSRRSTIRS